MVKGKSLYILPVLMNITWYDKYYDIITITADIIRSNQSTPGDSSNFWLEFEWWVKLILEHLYNNCCILPGIIIMGGFRQGGVELYNPKSKQSCHLASLPDDRFSHSSCGDLVCGGGKSPSSQRSCLHISTLLTPGSRRNIQLSQRRRDHLCWKMPGGDDEVLLLGGTYSPSSTEVVKGTKSSSSFRLQDKTE